jgi:subtilisin family serine protease
MEFILNADKTFQEKTGKKAYTADDLKALKLDDQMLNTIKDRLIMYLGQVPHEQLFSQVKDGFEHYDSELKYHLNKEYDARKDILKDNADDWNSKSYGNANVIGPEKEGAKHGTHVAGIIAQARHNDVGGDGVATPYVEIMAVRAVPDGDEYDKDVALAIRYAVDNGAKVINGSFGKYYSPHSQWVYDALKYAGEKDVLVVFAAGNEGIDLDADKSERYPNDDKNTLTEYTNNVLTIGALTYNFNKELVADFSNYGKTKVDVFSPGVQIYATVPNNEYEFLQGTSMASPNAAGVAALVRAFYPKLTAKEVKQIIMQSGIAIPLEVALGGDENTTRQFKDVCRSGKIVNAYNAIILADKVSRGEKL